MMYEATPLEGGIEVEIVVNAKVHATVPWGPVHTSRGPKVTTYTRSTTDQRGRRVPKRFFILPEGVVVLVINGRQTYAAGGDKYMTCREGKLAFLTHEEAAEMLRADPPDYGPEWTWRPELSPAPAL